jgi:hypothetical protein
MVISPGVPGEGRPGRWLPLGAALIAPIVLAACGSSAPAAQRPASSQPATAQSATAQPGTSQPAATQPAASQPPAVRLPPPNAPADYQIGKAYQPPAGVRVVSRDRAAAPVPGLYNICYVNAFQAQPAELAWWKANHGDLLLRGSGGRYVIDTDWNENLLDTSTTAKRTALAAVVDTWIDGCAAGGFQAVEPDNSDSYQRSQGLLTQPGALAYLALIADHAHRLGLAVGQKNTVELGTAGRDRAGLNFAIAEECGRYDECADYTAVYGTHLIDIEYERAYFTRACAQVGRTSTVILRDVDVTGPDSETYQYASC